MNRWQEMVREFHVKFQQPVGTSPRLLDNARFRARVSWIDDELGEMESGQAVEEIEPVADAIVDTLYFLIGNAVEMGIDLDPLFNAVHAANMAKVGGGQRYDGKIMKPAGWTEPDIADELRKQGWEG